MIPIARWTFLFLLLLSAGRVRGEEPVLRPADMVVFLGGEDMVSLAESGLLEAALVRQPGLATVRFRSMAFEGDTVFEQFRDLNFPVLEEALSTAGATVIVAQFGQEESLRGDPVAFERAMDEFIGRLRKSGRRLVLVSPTPFERPPGFLPDQTAHNAEVVATAAVLRGLAERHGARYVDLTRLGAGQGPLTRDGRHLAAAGQRAAAREILRQLGYEPAPDGVPGVEELRRVIIEKNTLWFHYHRPQNWAFLHGDRTEQPSSRDHRDRKVRWFPAEMEKYVPLIQSREREIAERAAALTR